LNVTDPCAHFVLCWVVRRVSGPLGIDCWHCPSADTVRWCILAHQPFPRCACSTASTSSTEVSRLRIRRMCWSGLTRSPPPLVNPAFSAHCLLPSSSTSSKSFPGWTVLTPGTSRYPINVNWSNAQRSNVLYCRLAMSSGLNSST
jgi:hypothetical protein